MRTNSAGKSSAIDYTPNSPVDYSSRNYVSTPERLKADAPLFFKPEDFTYEQELVKFDHCPDLCAKFAIDRANHPEAWHVKSTKRPLPTPKKDGPIFPVMDGYMKINHKQSAVFRTKVFNLSRRYNLTDTRILCNPCARHMAGNPVCKNPKYKRDIGLVDAYCIEWYKLLADLYFESCVEKVDVKMHANTFSGPPNVFPNGAPFEKQEGLYGHIEDFASKAQVALRKNYNAIKRAYQDKIFTIHMKQLDYSKYDPNDLPLPPKELMYQHIITSALLGARFNNPDPLKEDPGRDITINDLLPTKDRVIGWFTREGIMTGKLDAAKYAQAYKTAIHAVFEIALWRIRLLFNCDLFAQLNAMIEARAILSSIEESVNGFASINDASLSGYDAFISHCQNVNGEFLFLNGDRSNAETFVTTNWDQYQQLVLPELRNLYRLQNTVVVLDPVVYALTGLPSGAARTTMMNWFAGTHEALFTLGKLLRVNYVDVAKKYFASVRAKEPFFVYGKFAIKLFMPTDDIPLIIKGPLEELDLAWLDKQDRLMSWDVSKNGMKTFGMQFDKVCMQASESSILGKLFFSEFPGFFVKDCFSFQSKLDLLPAELVQDLDTLLFDMFDTHLNFYSEPAKAYLGWLADFGIPISETINQYSPSANIIYKRFVDTDVLFDSTRVDSYYLEPSYNWYRNVYSKYKE